MMELLVYAAFAVAFVVGLLIGFLTGRQDGYSMGLWRAMNGYTIDGKRKEEA